MGIYNALFTGSSGLSAFGEAVRVIGDNIANVNSLGFKSQNVVFADVLSQTVGVTRSNIANQVGNGVRIGQITRDSAQGSIQNTTSPTDMAINGRGMFALKDPASGETFYSRAGAFFLDKDFNLIDGQGFVVQGWALDDVSGSAIGNVTDVTFANLAAQAKKTDVVNVGVSLDSNAAPISGNVVATAGAATAISTGATPPNAAAQNAAIAAAQAIVLANGGVQTDLDAVAAAFVAPVLNPVTSAATYAAGITAASTAVGTVIPTGTMSAGTITAAAAAASAAVTGAAATGTFNPEDPATYNYKSQVNVFDSLGQKHAVSVYYVKTSSNNWNWYSGVDGADIEPGSADAFGNVATAGKSFIASYGTLGYGTQGELLSEVINPTAGKDAAGFPVGFAWNSANASQIGLNFGAATTLDAQGPSLGDGGLIGNGLDGTVQTAGSFATRQMTANGFPSGFLDRLETDSTGRIFGAFTNGQRRALFQVALASFPNDSVLSHVGNNLQQETIASGQAVFEQPGNGGMGSITPYGLEQSNVDLAAEFVKLIVIQRGYEANSKTIMTTDQMLSSLMQIKR